MHFIICFLRYLVILWVFNNCLFYTDPILRPWSRTALGHIPELIFSFRSWKIHSLIIWCWILLDLSCHSLIIFTEKNGLSGLGQRKQTLIWKRYQHIKVLPSEEDMLLVYSIIIEIKRNILVTFFAFSYHTQAQHLLYVYNIMKIHLFHIYGILLVINSSLIFIFIFLLQIWHQLLCSYTQ